MDLLARCMRIGTLALSAGSFPTGSPVMTNAPRNRILASLPTESFERLAGHLEEVELSLRQVLVEPNEPTEHVYFLEAGLGSVIAVSRADDEIIEVGHIGFEGMSGTHCVLGVDRTPTRTFMQVPGSAQRIRADCLAQTMDEDRVLRAHLLRYVQSFQLQLAYSALANGRYTIPVRLARWLLMCHDRIGSEVMPLQHEFLALMLGVRRSGVTTEIHVLEGVHAIKATRARIQILDRAKLEEFAGGCYGIPEAEYVRLMEQPEAANQGVRSST